MGQGGGRHGRNIDVAAWVGDVGRGTWVGAMGWGMEDRSRR